ncbi:MAG: molybdopterin-dependent oxidoreductase, partial [Desulfobacterales bacterium]
GVLPLRGQNNVQGACDMGALPGVLPGYQPVTDADARSRFAAIWGTDRLPAKPGLTVVEMMHAAAAGQIKTLWIMGEDPLNSDPNAKHVREALSHTDFLIVQDIFLTDTAQLADLVLPAAAWAEKSGTFTNTERRVQWCDPAVPALNDARSDLWIINAVGKRLDLELNAGNPPAVLNEINTAVPAYGGITRRRAAQSGGVHWPCPTEDHPGTPILHTDQFATANGKGRFLAVTHHPPAEAISDAYPLVLTTGRLALHYNSGSMTRRTAPLMERVPTLRVELHPDDAGRWDIEAGEPVKVISPRGQITAEAWVTTTVDPGVVFVPFHFPGANELTNDALDGAAKIPEFKVAACRLEKGGQG